jgi:hypothetical protein
MHPADVLTRTVLKWRQSLRLRVINDAAAQAMFFPLLICRAHNHRHQFCIVLSFKRARTRKVTRS